MLYAHGDHVEQGRIESCANSFRFERLRRCGREGQGPGPEGAPELPCVGLDVSDPVQRKLIVLFPARNVFLGLANDRLNRNDVSEQAYLAATRIKDNDRTAWQGLLSLYEKQGSAKLDAYRDVVLKFGQILADKYTLSSFQW